ncbi:AT7 [Scenedesmus sp. PABB004]|nr:AT7 [Scenedesmus sp. PABB004]
MLRAAQRRAARAGGGGGAARKLGGLAAMWAGISCVMRAASAPAARLGLRLAPHFINPFGATSLTDFWARRWNITQGLVLRALVYEPIAAGRLVRTANERGGAGAAPPRWRRQAAAAATFVWSGLEHDLFLFYVLRRPGGRWLLFFSAQGALLAAEGALRRRAAAAGLALHPRVALLAVLLCLGITADLWFWPDLLALLDMLHAALPPWARALGARAAAAWP